MYSEDRRRRRRVLILFALAALAALAIEVGTISHRSEARPDSATLTVSRTPYSRPLAPGFVGLSLEYTTLSAYVGQDPHSVNPLLVTLIQRLAPNANPALRFGGDSADWTWVRAPRLHRPPGIRFTITNRWLRSVRALADATNARFVLGINLEANSRRLAATEARALTDAIGKTRIAALEIGNEPELYGSFPWYVTPSGRPVPGRPPGWNIRSLNREFARFGAVLPRLPLAGPAIGGQRWIGYTARFVAAQRRLSLVTLHRYPLRRCYLPSASSMYATVRHLLSPIASRGLADGLAPYATVAHRRGLPLRIDELNSVSCGGVRGVSDTFASALWSLDTLFALARAGVDGVNFHTFAGAAYAPFRFTRSAHAWRASVKPEYYGMLMFNEADPPGARLLRITGRLPTATRAWATRSNTGTTRVVLINEGRRQKLITLRAPKTTRTATLERLKAPSIRAIHRITLGGQSFGTTTTTGVLAGHRRTAPIRSDEGVYPVRLPAVSAALLTLP